MREKYVILSETMQEFSISKDVLSDTAIILYLYYEDTLQNYFYYIRNIPKEITLYVYSSQETVCQLIRDFLISIHKENGFVFYKENRGRDVSALLVEAKDVIKKYEYICFVHDKKANAEYLIKDTEKWVELLWENTLASKEFIFNIISVFENNVNIGMLVPPKPVGRYLFTGLRNCWGSNYQNTVELAKKMELSCEIEADKSPLSIGTVFWARSVSLAKLLNYDWQYTDFVEEPMPIDGTISHAIERILSYVVEDAEYETSVVMTNRYAEKKMADMQENIGKAFELLYEELGVSNINSLNTYYEEKEKLERFCKQNVDFYLYGAGEFGQRCYKILKTMGVLPKGFIVTKKGLQDEVNGLPVIEFEEIKEKTHMAIIVCLSFKYCDEVMELLENNGFMNYMCYG